MSRTTFTRLFALLAVCVLLWPAGRADAQGVTTGAISGVVKDDQGAVIPGATVVAEHVPSGSNYEAVTQADGRFVMPGMRVGGPYTVTASLPGFTSAAKNNISVSLGVTQDLDFGLRVANVSETITVIGQSDPVFSSGRTGAATAVMREDLATLPTISGRITDITRLTPQYGGSGSFAGQDNRANNMTVDGAYFNNSFGLGVTTGGIGDRTGVAPISLEAIEQVQVSVAPYDVRQGSFTGAGVNTVTRSGTNNFTASGYFRTRNEDCSDLTNVDTCSGFVGTNSAANRVNPGNFKTRTEGVWAGGPIVKNKVFAFGSFEKQEDTRPLTTFTSNPGGAPVAGNTTRVNASDLQGLSNFLQTNFKLRHRSFRQHPEDHPGQAVAVEGRLQRQQRQQGDVQVQPARLEQSDPAVGVVVARHEPRRQLHAVPDLPELGLRDSREPQVGHRRMELGVRQHDEQLAAWLYPSGREPRSSRPDAAFPVRRHWRGRQRQHRPYRVR